MRTRSLALATVLAAAALSVQAGPRMEATGPFTYEAVGATPVLTFGRAATRAAEASAPSAAPKAVANANANANAKATASTATTRATASSTFTYDALGATPHVTVKKQPARSEAQLPAAAAH